MYELMCIEAALVCVATLLWASPEVGGAVHGRTRCHHNTPLFINTHILSSRHILYHHDTHSLNTPTQTHPPDPPPPLLLQGVYGHLAPAPLSSRHTLS